MKKTIFVFTAFFMWCAAGDHATAQTTDTSKKVKMKEVLIKPGEEAHEKGMTRKEALHIKSQRASVKVSKPGQATNGISLNGGITAFANAVSGRNKRANQALQADNDAQIKKFTATRYTPDLVTSLTGLYGDSLYSFMYHYPMPYQVARSYSDLELKIWIRDSYKGWQAKGRPMHKQN